MMPELTSRIARSVSPCVFLLDDADDLAAFAHDAAIAGRVGQIDGQDRQLIALGAVQQALQRCRANQRDVTV